jgi:hypothetical protein
MIKLIAGNGQIPGEWALTRNFLIVSIKSLLEEYNQKFPDSKTF